MQNKIGIMEGRLLPKYNRRYQAHPVGYWRDEFSIAKQMGLDLIEFILDFNQSDMNPLLSDTGISEIQTVIETSGVFVQTICADYFMEAPFHSIRDDVVEQSTAVLEKLLRNGKIIGVTDIVIPCVDQSQLTTQDDRKRFAKNIRPSVQLAEKLKINLALETDLDPKTFAELLEEISSQTVTVNYDTGNSAALGFDPTEELAAYGVVISDIHIKDRLLGGGSVVLGSGNADFPKFFKALDRLNYRGPFIFQAFRDDDGIEIFKTQFQWMMNRFLKTRIYGS